MLYKRNPLHIGTYIQHYRHKIIFQFSLPPNLNITIELPHKKDVQLRKKNLASKISENIGTPIKMLNLAIKFSLGYSRSHIFSFFLCQNIYYYLAKQPLHTKYVEKKHPTYMRLWWACRLYIKHQIGRYYTFLLVALEILIVEGAISLLFSSIYFASFICKVHAR